MDAVPQALSHLPRLAHIEVKNPHELLDGIGLGIDFFTIPFINEATDAGIAFDFTFGGSPDAHGEVGKELALDMWSTSYATDLSPLRQDCRCYACVNHHRAYVQHLLNAREMLSWVLLQLHNLHVMNGFFAAVRQSVEQGFFEKDAIEFRRTYRRTLPEKTGQGPR